MFGLGGGGGGGGVSVLGKRSCCASGVSISLDSFRGRGDCTPLNGLRETLGNMSIITLLKLWVAVARHNFKWVKVI